LLHGHPRGGRGIARQRAWDRLMNCAPRTAREIGKFVQIGGAQPAQQHLASCHHNSFQIPKALNGDVSDGIAYEAARPLQPTDVAGQQIRGCETSINLKKAENSHFFPRVRAKKKKFSSKQVVNAVTRGSCRAGSREKREMTPGDRNCSRMESFPQRQTGSELPSLPGFTKQNAQCFSGEPASSIWIGWSRSLVQRWHAFSSASVVAISPSPFQIMVRRLLAKSAPSAFFPALRT
jgi:hypothetical protein